MTNKESIKEIVIREFSSKSVQETYKRITKQGLWKSEEKLFKKYLKKGSVLDVGCGSGRTTFPLVRMGYKVIGVDLTPAMIKSAKELSKEFKIKVDFRTGDATDLEFKNESFDNVLFSWNGWNFIPERKNRLKALKEIYRVLKPNGYFIFTSHIRKIRRLAWIKFWFIQWIRMYILRLFGYKMKEKEWGDIFFKKGSIVEFEREQYINIPKLSEVKFLIKKVGFILEYNEYKNTISTSEKRVKRANWMFFVCRKPVQ